MTLSFSTPTLSTPSPIGSIHSDAVTPNASPSSSDPQHMVLAFYNTENFFDTLPSPHLPNDPYTPSGTYRWNTERYFRKVQHIARVLDSLKADLVGLAEVENETVLRDLVSQLHTSYNYLIQPGRDPRGINVALLYRGSQFFPLHTFQIKGPGLTRPVLGVQGRLQDDTLTLLIAHLPSLLNQASWRKAATQTLQQRLQRLIAQNPRTKIILMGDLNMVPSSALAHKLLGVRPWPAPSLQYENDHSTRSIHEPEPLFTPFTTLERSGEGSYLYRDRRYVYDYFLLNRTWFEHRGWQFRDDYGIFAPNFLFHPDGPKRGYPQRTFDRGRYIGGFSDHFPVWIVLEK